MSEPLKQSIDDILKERGGNYGTFIINASYAQQLKDVARSFNKWDKFAPDQAEAIDNILQKIARMGNGSADYQDSWVDIIGYSTLVLNRLKQDESCKKT